MSEGTVVRWCTDWPVGPTSFLQLGTCTVRLYVPYTANLVNLNIPHQNQAQAIEMPAFEPNAILRGAQLTVVGGESIPTSNIIVSGLKTFSSSCS